MAEAGAADAVRRQIAALFDAHGPSLYRFARAVVRDPADAEDIVQETFVRLLAHLRGAGDTSNLKAWLFMVTANASRDVLRRRRRWLPWGAEREGRCVTDESRNDEQRLLMAAAGRVSPRDRMLLTLRAEGASYREIAAATGIREQSVGRLLARAAARWQRAYRDEVAEHHEHMLHGHRASGIGRG